MTQAAESRWELTWHRLRRLVWWGGLALLAAIALAAWLYVAVDLSTATAKPTTLRAIAWAVGSLLGAAIAWLVILRARAWVSRHPLAVGTAAVALTRLVAVAVVHAPVQSDFLLYHQLATEVARQGPFLADVPTGFPILLGAFYRVLGPSVVVGQLVECGLAVAAGWLVYDLTRALWSSEAAMWALLLYALSPAQVLMATILASEGPYAVLVLAAVWLALRLDGRLVVGAAAVGVTLALSQYVRSTSLVLVPALAALPFLRGVRPTRAVASAFVLTLAFVVSLGPVIAWNQATSRGLSLATSTYGGWSLLVGTDPAHNGGYNAALATIVGGTAGTPAFDRRAAQIAIERVTAHPRSFLALAIRKFPTMWGNESYGVDFAINAAPAGDKEMGRGFQLLSQVTYAVVLLLALLGVLAERQRRHPLVLTMLLIVAAVAALHTFVEIQPRYHSYLVPLFCVFAGQGVVIVWRRAGERRLAEPGGLSGVSVPRKLEV